MSLINLQPALEKAIKKFSELDPLSMSERSRSTYNQYQREFCLPFLGEEYVVKYPSGEILKQQGGEVSITERVCIIHYLVNASTMNVQGGHVAFRQLPSGDIYIGPFTNRTIRPLVSIFGKNPDKMVSAGEMLGGRVEKIGDYAVTIDVFPKIPITFVLWEGDEEFPPSGNVLFDTSAPAHLDTEDYAMLPGLAIFKMKKLAQI